VQGASWFCGTLVAEHRLLHIAAMISVVVKEPYKVAIGVRASRVIARGIIFTCLETSNRNRGR